MEKTKTEIGGKPRNDLWIIDEADPSQVLGGNYKYGGSIDKLPALKVKLETLRRHSSHRGHILLLQDNRPYNAGGAPVILGASGPTGTATAAPAASQGPSGGPLLDGLQGFDVVVMRASKRIPIPGGTIQIETSHLSANVAKLVQAASEEAGALCASLEALREMHGVTVMVEPVQAPASPGEAVNGVPVEVPADEVTGPNQVEAGDQAA